MYESYQGCEFLINEGQRNRLTGPSANTINALLAANDPFKNLTIVSLNDRRRLIEFLEIPVPFDWEKAPIGTRIVQTNTILYDGLHAAGIPGSARTVSVFSYFEPVKALWKPEHTVTRTDESVSVILFSLKSAAGGLGGLVARKKALKSQGVLPFLKLQKTRSPKRNPV